MKIVLKLLLVFISINSSCATNVESGETEYGEITVPENRNSSSSRNIAISYARIRSKNKSNEPPLVFIQGGPGGSSLVMVPFFEKSPLRENRDVILFDARGTGDSEAYCKNAGGQFLKLMAKDLTVEEEYEETIKICIECKEELAANKVDLAGYNSLENAADLEALREHLDIGKWVLFGGSYGSRLGLTYLRDYEGAEAAIFMGLFPLEANIYNELLGGFDASLRYLFESCEADPKCNDKYPNLESTFHKLVEDLRKQPKHVSYEGQDFVINAQDALLLVHQMLYERSTIRQVPAFINALMVGNSQRIGSAIDRTAYTMAFINSATYWSVQANEELQFNTEDAINSTMPEYAYLRPAPSFFATDQKVLEQWHPYRADARENEKVVTDTPVLIVSGVFDPITPISNGRAVGDYLPNAKLVEFPYDGHSIFNSCFFELVDEFTTSGYKSVSNSCAKEGSIRWL